MNLFRYGLELTEPDEHQITIDWAEHRYMHLWMAVLVNGKCIHVMYHHDSLLIPSLDWEHIGRWEDGTFDSTIWHNRPRKWR